VFKTLGATTRILATMLALEYSALGALAGLIGAAGSLAFGWAFCRLVLDIPWSATPGIVLPGVVLTSALVGALGVGASLDVLRRKPLGILRAE
jgi:putative ABC transport system permease protein